MISIYFSCDPRDLQLHRTFRVHFASPAISMAHSRPQTSSPRLSPPACHLAGTLWVNFGVYDQLIRIIDVSMLLVPARFTTFAAGSRSNAFQIVRVPNVLPDNKISSPEQVIPEITRRIVFFPWLPDL